MPTQLFGDGLHLPRGYALNVHLQHRRSQCFLTSLIALEHFCAEAALPIWTEFMKNATANMPVTDFVAPAPMPDTDDGVPSKCGPTLPDGGAGTNPCPPAAVQTRSTSDAL